MFWWTHWVHQKNEVYKGFQSFPFLNLMCFDGQKGQSKHMSASNSVLHIFVFCWHLRKLSWFWKTLFTNTNLAEQMYIIVYFGPLFCITSYLKQPSIFNKRHVENGKNDNPIIQHNCILYSHCLLKLAYSQEVFQFWSIHKKRCHITILSITTIQLIRIYPG